MKMSEKLEDMFYLKTTRGGTIKGYAVQALPFQHGSLLFIQSVHPKSLEDRGIWVLAHPLAYRDEDIDRDLDAI